MILYDDCVLWEQILTAESGILSIDYSLLFVSIIVTLQITRRESNKKIKAVKYLTKKYLPHLKFNKLSR